MPLIVCPDCDRPMSDAAPACPQCGRPMVSHRTPTSPGFHVQTAPAKNLKDKNVSGLTGCLTVVGVLIVIGVVATNTRGCSPTDRAAATNGLQAPVVRRCQAMCQGTPTILNNFPAVCPSCSDLYFRFRSSEDQDSVDSTWDALKACFRQCPTSNVQEACEAQCQNAR